MVNRDSPPAAPVMTNHFTKTQLPPSGFPPLSTRKSSRPKPEPDVTVGLQKQFGNPSEIGELATSVSKEAEYTSERPTAAPQAGGV